MPVQPREAASDPLTREERAEDIDIAYERLIPSKDAVAIAWRDYTFSGLDPWKDTNAIGVAEVARRLYDSYYEVLGTLGLMDRANLAVQFGMIPSLGEFRAQCGEAS